MSGILYIFFFTYTQAHLYEITYTHVNVVPAILLLVIRGGSRTAATSKMEHFVIIVNGWKPLTIITKSSILDVAVVLDPPLVITHLLSFIYIFVNELVNIFGFETLAFLSWHFVGHSCEIINNILPIQR